MKIKYLNIILSIIAVLLLSIAFKLTGISALITVSSQNVQAVKDFNKELLDSNRRLEKSFSGLIQEIESLNNKLMPKREGGVGDAK